MQLIFATPKTNAMRNIYLCLILCSSLFTIAQKPPIKFGDVPMEDMKMTVYPNDSSAEAVILADYGESSVVYDQGQGAFQIKFDRIRRIKILTKDGLRWADFSISLYHDNGKYEKLTGLKVVTYNLENGKVVESKLKNDAILKEKYDANVDITKVSLGQRKSWVRFRNFLYHFV